MKVLVTIANYGTKNDGYLHQVLEGYRAMSHQVHVVALTNVSKDLGPGVEVVIEIPKGDPWSFPFAHKKILADRVEDYDLFIYSEDDTLITEKNLQAFLAATEVLHEDEIAGFLRTEIGADGRTYLSSVHSHFHWDPDSVVRRGNSTFAFFTNEHSACYVLTRKQLQKAIRSGGFLVEPHQGKYDLLVTAATDPYTQCGFRKLIDLNHLQDFLLPHLPNKYIGQMGLAAEDFFRQAEALKAIGSGSRPAGTLPDTETKLKEARWSKSYYEPAREDLLHLLPAGARSVLSYGCGWGALESALVQKGMEVTAIPLDSVVGACAEARGVPLHYAAKGMGKNGTPAAAFDVVMVSNMLHLSPDPVALLISLVAYLKPQGKLLAAVPNLSRLPVLKRRLAGDPDYKAIGEFAQAGVQVTSSRKLRGWFEKSHLDVQQVVPVITNKRNWMRYFPESLFGEWLGDDFLVLAQKN